MILGLLPSLEFLMPADAEWSKSAMFQKEEVVPSGQRNPSRISLPILIMLGDMPASDMELDNKRV